MKWWIAALGLVACASPTRPPAVTLASPRPSAAPETHGSLQPPPASTSYAWQWSGDRPGVGSSVYPSARRVRDNAIECTFTYEERPPLARTACSVGGREVWHHDESRAFLEDAALVLDHGTLYSARYMDISNGCTLYAFDALTGRERWSTPLKGLGPIGHSQYLNAVELRLIRGRPVVFGWESAGRYVEAVDTPTGATVSHMVLPASP